MTGPQAPAGRTGAAWAVPADPTITLATLAIDRAMAKPHRSRGGLNLLVTFSPLLFWM
jgi:hypothetical protein